MEMEGEETCRHKEVVGMVMVMVEGEICRYMEVVVMVGGDL